MPQYIQKLRIPVRLARVGAPPTPGLLSLAPYAELHDGPETVLECLNAPQRFVPLLCDGEGAVVLVAREQIEWVEPDAGVDAALVRPAPFMPTREEDVVVRMTSGETLEGVISMEMPDESNRTSDYLNAAGPFFPLRMPVGIRLLNKLRVVEVFVRPAQAASRAA